MANIKEILEGLKYAELKQLCEEKYGILCGINNRDSFINLLEKVKFSHEEIEKMDKISRTEKIYQIADCAGVFCREKNLFKHDMFSISTFYKKAKDARKKLDELGEKNGRYIMVNRCTKEEYILAK